MMLAMRNARLGRGFCSARLSSVARRSLCTSGDITSRCAPVAIPSNAGVVDFLKAQGRWEAATPDKPAIVDTSSGEVVRYGDLECRINGCAHALHELGFRQGDVLSVHLHNCTEFIIAFMAVASLGGATSPSNPAYVAEELARQLSDSSAKFVLSSAEYRETVLGAVASLPADASPPPRVCFIEDGDCFAKAAPRETAVPLPRPIDAQSDLVVLPYSSGTTGRPKGVMLSHTNLVANTLQMCADPFARFAFDEKDSLLGLLPLYHIYGMTVLMLGSLAYQATLVLMPRFEPDAFLSIIEQRRISVACLVPPLCLFLAKSPAVDAADLSSLKYIYSGAAPLDAAQELAVIERLAGLQRPCHVQIRQA